MICVAALLGPARAQEINLAAGGSTLWSTKSTNASAAYQPAAEKGGTYASVSAAYILSNHFGLSVEGVGRPTRGLYNQYQPYRPFLYDVNGIFTKRLYPRTNGELMAGVGAQTTVFYDVAGGCPVNGGGCRTYVDSTHLLLHAGGGVRYYIWKNYFVRPEAHYYYVKNNFEFHSNNVFRVGASIGYTFGR